MQHEFKVVAVDTEGNKDPDPAIFVWTISESTRSQPIADAGPNQSVKSNDIVQLDGTNSSDPNDSLSLRYHWIQTKGPEVSLSDSSSSSPTFTAPKVNDLTELIFELTVTNNEGITSEPDEVMITVNPVISPPPEQPSTIGDLIKAIIQNPLNVTNSIDSANEIKEILTDNNRDNDQIVCDLIGSEDEETISNIREILNC
jgi:hypothetical protein